jgi:hypothetical protein
MIAFGGRPPIQYPLQGSRVMPAPWGGNPPRAGGPGGFGGEGGIPPVHPVGPERPVIGGFKKGGKVPKTGKYLLHKNEHVVKAGSRRFTNRKPQKMVSVGALKGY